MFLSQYPSNSNNDPIEKTLKTLKGNKCTYDSFMVLKVLQVFLKKI